MCKPREEGGLSITRLEEQMKAFKMKLAWIANNRESQWSKLLKAKFKEWAHHHHQIKGPTRWASLPKA